MDQHNNNHGSSLFKRFNKVNAIAPKVQLHFYRDFNRNQSRCNSEPQHISGIMPKVFTQDIDQKPTNQTFKIKKGGKLGN